MNLCEKKRIQQTPQQNPLEILRNQQNNVCIQKKLTSGFIHISRNHGTCQQIGAQPVVNIPNQMEIVNAQSAEMATRLLG